MKTFLSYGDALKNTLNMKKRSLINTFGKRIVLYIYDLQRFELSWVVFSGPEDIQQTVLHGDIKDLSLLANEYDIYVIILGQDVVLTQARLPKLTGEKLSKALPYALEDKLIEDVEHVHFALNQLSSEETNVAIISKQKIERYLHSLSEHGIIPKIIIPVMLALPCLEHDWFVCCNNDIGVLRMSSLKGFVCDRPNLNTLLQLQLAASSIPPKTIHVENASGEPMHFTYDSIPVNEVFISEKQWLEKMAISFEKHPIINLLQGKYRPKQNIMQTKKMWLTASALAMVWFSVLLAGHMMSFFTLHSEKNQATREIAHIYYQQFPQAASVVAPRERMEAELKKPLLNHNQQDFLSLISAFANVKANFSSIHLLSLRYDKGQLSVSLAPDSLNTVHHFMQGLTDKGLKVQKQDANNAEEKMTLLITR